jgi:hypothetical protein
LRDQQETLEDESRDKLRAKSALRPGTSHAVSGEYNRALDEYEEHKKELLTSNHLDTSERNKERSARYELHAKKEVTSKGSTSKPPVKGKSINRPKTTIKHTAQSLGRAKEQKRYINSKGNKSSEVVKTDKSCKGPVSLYNATALTDLTPPKESTANKSHKVKDSPIEAIPSTSGDKSTHIESMKKANIHEEEKSSKEAYSKDKPREVPIRGILKKRDNSDYEKYKLMFEPSKSKKTLERLKSAGSRHTDFDVARQTEFIKESLKQHKYKQAPYSITQFDKHCWECFGRELVCS